MVVFQTAKLVSSTTTPYFSGSENQHSQTLLKGSAETAMRKKRTTATITKSVDGLRGTQKHVWLKCVPLNRLICK